MRGSVAGSNFERVETRYLDQPYEPHDLKAWTRGSREEKGSEGKILLTLP